MRWWSSESAAVTRLNKGSSWKRTGHVWKWAIHISDEPRCASDQNPLIISFSDARMQSLFSWNEQVSSEGLISHQYKRWCCGGERRSGGGKAGHKTRINLQPQDLLPLQEKPVMSHVHAFKLIYLDPSDWLTGTSPCRRWWWCRRAIPQGPHSCTPPKSVDPDEVQQGEPKGTHTHTKEKKRELIHQPATIRPPSGHNAKRLIIHLILLCWLIFLLTASRLFYYTSLSN